MAKDSTGTPGRKLPEQLDQISEFNAEQNAGQQLCLSVPTGGHQPVPGCPGQLREKSTGSNTPATHLLLPKALWKGQRRGQGEEREQQWDEEALAGWGHCRCVSRTTPAPGHSQQGKGTSLCCSLAQEEQSLVTARHGLECPGQSCECHQHLPVPSPACRVLWKATPVLKPLESPATKAESAHPCGWGSYTTPSQPQPQHPDVPPDAPVPAAPARSRGQSLRSHTSGTPPCSPGSTPWLPCSSPSPPPPWTPSPAPAASPC